MGESAPSQRIDLLLVEDNVDDVSIFRHHVRRLPGDYRVEIAYTGAEALDKARMRPYDAMLIDQLLPDYSGEQLITELRAAVPELPTIMLTGQGDEQLAVTVMKAGAYDYLRKDGLTTQLLQRTLHSVIERARLEKEVRQAHERLRERAIRDGLTGLYNHRHFQEQLRSEFARATRYDEELSCVMLDLDHFKSVNDTYGHPVGDEVLKHLARMLEELARQYDIIARYGGEEFVLLLPNTPRTGATALAQRVCEQLASAPFEFEEIALQLTVSAGVASTADERVNSEADLVKLADEALYRAKHEGRNRVCVAEPTSTTDSMGFMSTPTPALGRPAMRVFESAVRRRVVKALRDVVRASESKGGGYEGHSDRTRELAQRIGARLGVTEAELETISVVGALHDIGRLAVSDSVWMKPGWLTDEERTEAQRHPEIGAALLNAHAALEAEAAAVRAHHERWDGSGYPDGLAGAAIPLPARVVSVAAGWVALTSSRPWRDPLEDAEAFAVLRDGAGAAYDPQVVDAMMAVLRERTEPR
jgi:diguanylate cyclase (GGDEF)-like protein